MLIGINNIALQSFKDRKQWPTDLIQTFRLYFLYIFIVSIICSFNDHCFIETELRSTIKLFINMLVKLIFNSQTKGGEHSPLHGHSLNPRSPETRISLATSAPARTALSCRIKESCPRSQQMLGPPVNHIQMLELSCFPVRIYVLKTPKLQTSVAAWTSCLHRYSFNELLRSLI